MKSSMAQPPSASDAGASGNQRPLSGSIGHESISEPSGCQHVREPKAFTGRGGARSGPEREEARLTDSVVAAEAMLVQLSQLTTRVPGRQMYLMLHKRKNGGHYLRWRHVGGGAPNIPWDEVGAMIRLEPPHLWDWYERMTHQALRANDELILARQALSLCRRRRKRFASLQ